MRDDIIEQLEARIAALEEKQAMSGSSSTLPLSLDQALTGRGFVKETVSNLSGTFYAATSSGGAVTHAVTFVNGRITSIS